MPPRPLPVRGLGRGKGMSALAPAPGDTATSRSGPPRETLAQLQEKMRIASQMRMVTDQLPGFEGEGTELLAIVQAGGTNDEVLERALQAGGFADIAQKVESWQEWDDTRQRSEWASLPASIQNAMLVGGYPGPPEQKKDGGFLGLGKMDALLASNPLTAPIVGLKIGKAGFSEGQERVADVPVVGPVASQAMGVVGAGVGGALGAFDWLGKESARLPRAEELRSNTVDAREMLRSRGEDPEAFEQRTGGRIDLGNEGGFFGLTKNLPTGMGMLGGLLNGPGQVAGTAMRPDFWKQWWGQGHNGEDDFLSTVKIEAWDLLEQDDPATVGQWYEVAEMLASGKDDREVLASIGLEPGSPEYVEFAKKLYVDKRTEGSPLRQAYSKMTAGKSSYGRMKARELQDLPFVGKHFDNEDLVFDPAKPFYKQSLGVWVSGSADAVYAVVADPTNVVGGLGKAARVARWGFQDMNAFTKYGHLMEAYELSLKVGKEAPEVQVLLGEFGRRKLMGIRDLNRTDDLLSMGEDMFNRFDRMAQGFRDGDLVNMARDVKGIYPVLESMMQVHNGRVAEGGEGLTTAAAMFEYFDDARHGFEIGKTVDDMARGQRIFGIDPHIRYVPHQGDSALKRIRQHDWYRNLVLDGRPLPKKVARDIQEDFGDEIANRGLETLDLELDELGNWAHTRRGPLRAFIHAMRTQTPKTRGFLHFHNDKDIVATEQANAFFDGLGVMSRMPRETIDRYTNLWLHGTEGQRALITTRFIEDAAVKSGLTQTKEGEALMRRFVHHMGQAYGLTDQVALAHGRQTPRQAVLTEQLAKGMAVPDYKEWLVATRKSNAIRMVTGNVNRGLIEGVFSKAWRPMQLIRLGFIMRAAGEEVFSFMLRHSAHEYFQAKVAQPWAEGTLPATHTSNPLVKPIKVFADSLAKMSGLTEDLGEHFGKMKAMGDSRYAIATPAAQRAMVVAAKQEYFRGTKVRRSTAHLQGMANWMALKSSRFFHDLGRHVHLPGKAPLTRQRIGEYLLSSSANRYEIAGAFMATSRLGPDMLASQAARSILLPDAVAEVTPTTSVLRRSVEHKGEYVSVPMKATGDFAYVTREDPGNFYLGAAQHLNHIAGSIGGKQALHEIYNYWPIHELDELHHRITGTGDMEAVRKLREQMRATWLRDVATPEEAAEYLARQKARRGGPDHFDVFYQLRAMGRQASGNDQYVLRSMLDGEGDFSALDIEDPGLAMAVARLEDNPNLLAALDPDSYGVFHGSFDDAWTHGAHRIYAEYRHIPNQSEARRMVRTMTFDGKTIADVAPEGVDDLYVPMIDKHAAPGVAAIFTTRADPTTGKKGGADIFAEKLQENLSYRGLWNRMPDIWDSSTSGMSGYAISDWMDAVQAEIAASGTAYMPAAMVASGNADIAYAVRDAIAETVAELGADVGGLAPTVGRIQIGRGNVGEQWGVVPYGQHKDIYHLATPKAIKAEALDPADLRDMSAVQFNDGRVITYSNSELWTMRRDPTPDEAKQGYVGVIRVTAPNGEVVEEPYRVIRQWTANGISEDTAFRRAAQDAMHETLRMVIGQKTNVPMRRLIRAMTSDNLDAHKLWRDMPGDELPDYLHAPRLIDPDEGKFANLVYKVQRGFFDGLSSPAITGMSHKPQFMYYLGHFAEQMDYVRAAYTNDALVAHASDLLSKHDIDVKEFRDFHWYNMGEQEVFDPDEWSDYAAAVEGGNHKGMVDSLERIFPGKNWDEVDFEDIEGLRLWHMNQHGAFAAHRQAALRRTHDVMIDFIDDSRIRSQFAENVGPLIPFWHAEEQFIKRVARGVAMTPWALRKAQLMVHGMESMGIVRTDNYGNKIFVWPGSEYVMGAIAPAVGLLFGDEARHVLPNAITMRVDYMMPGYSTQQLGRFNWGPLAAIPLGLAARRFPEFGKVQDALYGEDRAGDRAVLEYLMPSYMVKSYQAAFQGDEDRQLGSAMMEAAQYLEANDQGLPEAHTPLQAEEYWDNVRGVARTMLALRAFTAWTGPTTGALDLDRNDLSQEFLDLLDTGIPYSEAVAAFLEVHPGADAYTIFKTENLAGGPVPLTEENYQWMLDNEDILKGFPNAAPWLMPQPDTRDEFNRRAYNESITSKMRRRRNPQEWQEEMYKAQAAPDYYKMKDQYDADIDALRRERDSGKISAAIYSQRRGERAMAWESDAGRYKKQHPVWAASLSAEGSDQRKATLAELKVILNDPELPGGERFGPMRDLLNEYDRFERRVDSISGSQSKIAVKVRNEERERFFGWALLHVNANPHLQAFWDTKIRPEVDNADQLEANLTTTGAANAG